MNKILTLLVFSLTTFIFAQDLDEAYLESLPESIRDDVLMTMTDREELDKPIYRRPSLMINKNYCDENNIEDGIYSQINTIGGPQRKLDRDLDGDNSYQRYFKDDKNCIVRSKRFGSNFFDMMQTSFMPINEPNLDGSYILDFGDTLEVQLIGSEDSINELPVKRDGSINISEIGKVFVSGLSLESAASLIKNKINSTYIGVEVFVSLISVRDIQVLITGNAFNPGIYTLNGNSNLLHALSMAGGVNEKGSFRQIDLIRQDKVINSIDLYDLFIFGKSNFNIRLRSGDSILVKPAKDLINITGAFERPAVYELKDKETFLDLYNYANGFSSIANSQTLRIERLDGEQVKYIDVKDFESLGLVKPLPGDSLNVRAYERRIVTVAGAVNTPGKYTLSKGETLSSIIQKAEGYKDDAYPFGGILINKKTLAINKQAAERLYTSFVQKLITKGDALFASESLPYVLEELKKSSVSGRVMAEFDLDVLKAFPNLDTNIDDGDTIVIPSITQQVYIYGEVNNTGTIRYKSGQSISKYISQSGGLLDSADDRNIFIVHPNGEVNRVQNNKIRFLNNTATDILIYPGSVIYVPRKVMVKDPALVASIWAPIISAFATSITTLSILDNNNN